MNTIEQYYISLKTLRSRGWTDKLVDQILGKEDIRTDNPYNRYAWMYLYDLQRVIRAEQDPLFIKKRKDRAADESMHVYDARGWLISEESESEMLA